MTPSDEEPIAAGGWQNTVATLKVIQDQIENRSNQMILPPPVTPSDEEPIGMGGRQL